MADGRAGMFLGPGPPAVATAHSLSFAIAIIPPLAVEVRVALVPDPVTMQGASVVVSIFFIYVLICLLVCVSMCLRASVVSSRR